jgi:hypothetical protein
MVARDDAADECSLNNLRSTLVGTNKKPRLAPGLFFQAADL